MVNPDKIRLMIRDVDELNVLLNNKEQFSDEEIQVFDDDARDELCVMYPALLSKRDTLPDIIIAQGVISKLMESVGHQENRNKMTISDDNVGQIDMSNKADKYFGIANAYYERMKGFAQNLTAASWYQDMWGYVPSESSMYNYHGNEF